MRKRSGARRSGGWGWYGCGDLPVAGSITDMLLDDILLQIISGVSCAILLAALGVWYHSWLLRTPVIDGFWTFELRVQSTSYRPFTNMTIQYVALLWTEGDRVLGSCEKATECVDGKVHVHVGRGRTQGIVRGRVQKRLFGRASIIIHVTENGTSRTSTSIHRVSHSAGRWTGHFVWTAANSAGSVVWNQGDHDLLFTGSTD